MEPYRQKTGKQFWASRSKEVEESGTCSREGEAAEARKGYASSAAIVFVHVCVKVKKSEKEISKLMDGLD
jgi:hypothetical protein